MNNVETKESLVLQLEQTWGNIAKAAISGNKNYYWRHIQEYNNLEYRYFRLTGKDYDSDEINNGEAEENL